MSTPFAIGLAKKCFKQNTQLRTIAFIPGAQIAKFSHVLPIRLNLKNPCPINTIAHIDQTTPGVFKHNLIGDGSASDQIVYTAGGAHDTAGQFDIVDATHIRLREATKAKSILVIEGDFEDN